jgi:hypothetical protein
VLFLLTGRRLCSCPSRTNSETRLEAHFHPLTSELNKPFQNLSKFSPFQTFSGGLLCQLRGGSDRKLANAGDFSVLSLWSSSALEGEGIVAGAAAAGGAGFFHKPRSPKQASVKEEEL